MSTEKNSVIVELYDLPLTERKDDRFGRVVTTKSIDEDDLIQIAISRRSDLSSSSMKATMDILKEIAIEQIANGASVRFGLGYFNVQVNGVFIGDNAKWDSSRHSLSVRVNTSSNLREAVKAATVEVRGMAASGLAINSVTDVSSGEVNTKLTPGGGANIIGSKIKIVGTDEGVGLKLTNESTSEATVIPTTSILQNDPSKISFVVPAGLATGDYKLSITTQFSSSAQMLKEPRTYSFEYVLSV